MSENSKIEWCDHTFNPWIGCTMVSPGCAHCYAARDAVRFPGIRGIWGDKGTRIVAVPSAWKAPIKWNKTAGLEQQVFNQPGPIRDVMGPVERPRVFCASLTDVFEDWKGDLRFPADLAPEGWVTARWNGYELVREFNETPMRADQRKATMDDARTELFRLIEATPNLDWLLLTKRPENVMRMVPESWSAGFPVNVWMGTTVENQEMADKRIPELLKIPAKVRFLSCEPLLGPVDLLIDGELSAWACPECVSRNVDPDKFSDDGKWWECPDCKEHGMGEPAWTSQIHWVICGGESGPKARPMHPDWARSLRDQCQAAHVPFLFKQWGEWAPGEVGGDYLNPEKPAVGLSYFDGKWVEDTSHPGGHRDDDPDVYHVGKKKAGRLLDGREWNEFPTGKVGA